MLIVSISRGSLIGQWFSGSRCVSESSLPHERPPESDYANEQKAFENPQVKSTLWRRLVLLHFADADAVSG